MRGRPSESCCAWHVNCALLVLSAISDADTYPLLVPPLCRKHAIHSGCHTFLIACVWMRMRSGTRESAHRPQLARNMACLNLGHVATHMLPSTLPRVAEQDTCHWSSSAWCTFRVRHWGALPVDTFILLRALRAVSAGYCFNEPIEVPAYKACRDQ